MRPRLFCAFLLPAAMALVACGSRSDLAVIGHGAGETEPEPDPDPVPLGGIVVAGGDYHTCAARSGGAAYCWGEGSQGQVGGGSTLGALTPRAVGLDGVVDLAAGWWHSCAVRADGRVLCWGSGAIGQLGNGSLDDHPTPVEPTGLPSALRVCAGMTFACALTKEGGVWCWGSNTYGELGGAGEEDPVLTPAPVPGVEGAAGIACGDHHACAALKSGTLLCWGSNQGEQIGPGATPAPVTPVPAVSEVREVAAGFSATCARTGAGAVRCWGGAGSKVPFAWPPAEILPPGSALAIDSRGTSHCAVTAAGVGCWGFASQIVGAPGPGTLVPVMVPGTEGAESVAVGGVVGESHACVVLGGDRLACWGRNSEGQVGDGTQEKRATPVLVELP